MFESIAIKKKQFGDSRIDEGFLIESLLFYKKVYIMADEFVLNDLFKICGFDLLKKLIKDDRIELKIRENYLGTMQFPDGKNFKYNVNVVTSDKSNSRNILYRTIQNITRNSTKSIKLTDDFLGMSSPYKYSEDITDTIRGDFANEPFMQRLFAESLNNIIPDLSLNSHEVECKIEKDGSFESFDAYGLKSNIDFDDLTLRYQKQTGKEYIINPSGIILDLAELRGDLSISTELNTGLVTDTLSSLAIDSSIQDLFGKLDTEQKGMDNFQEIVLDDFIDIGETIRTGKCKFSDFILIIEKADKFKDWLSKVDEDSNLINEYYSALKEGTWLDKHVPKALRFSAFTGAGIGLDLLLTGGIGTVAGITLGAIDSFLLDNLIKGWKPDQFVNKDLKSNLITKK